MDIDKIILKALNKKASLEEYEALDAWRNESQANLKYLETLDLQKTGNERYTHFDKQSAWERINNRISKPMNLMTYVIGAIIVIGILALMLNDNGKKESYPKVYESNDQIASIDLIDASSVQLNREAQLTQLSDFSQERRVTLKGEAYFDVAHDPENPFVIELSKGDFIKVVGTSFNLINTEDEFELAVLTGKVELHTLNRTIELNKGDKVVSVNGAFALLRNTDVNLLSWKDRKLIFNSTPIQQVIKNLEDYFGIEARLAKDVNPQACVLQSIYEDPQLDEILNEMKKIFNMEYVLDNNKLDIISLNCQ